MTDKTQEEKSRPELDERKAQQIYAQCNRIDDPLKRGLCKVCGTPVGGTMSFCQEHEPPVP